MDFSEINSISRSAFKPTKKLKELAEDTMFAVTNIRRVNTRYGMQTVVELNGSFEMFLPARVNNHIDRRQKVYDDLCEAVQKDQLTLHNLRNGFFEFIFE